jgi:hypothetical protein
MRTREQFVARAVKDYERRLGIPEGWWGDYQNIQSPGGVTVRFTGACWVVRSGGALVSKHDSREGAIRKARAL